MRQLIFIFLFTSIHSFIQGQNIILISNPSFEVKKETVDPFPMGWHTPTIEKYTPATVHWKTESRKPSQGQSFVTLSHSDSTNQAISISLSKNPIPAFTTYRMEIDASLMDNSNQGKLQVIGIGKSETEHQILATSWPIDYNDWKKSVLELTPAFDIYAIQLESITDNNKTTIAIDNISNLNRIRGEYDCVDFIRNGFSRSAIDYYSIGLGDKKYEMSEGKFHCAYTSFYTQKVLFDAYGTWDEAIYYDNDQNEKLLWNNVYLLPKSDKVFSIAATGYEDEFDVYSSIIVFDEHGVDMLSANNPLAPKIMKVIGDLIKNNKTSDKRFFEFYKLEIGR